MLKMVIFSSSSIEGLEVGDVVQSLAVFVNVVCNSSTAFSTPDRHSDDVATDDACAAGTIMFFC